MNGNSQNKRCELCGNAEFDSFINVFDRYARHKGPYLYLQCQHCGLVQIFHIPTEEERIASYPVQIVNPFIDGHGISRNYLEKIYSFFHPYSVEWRIKQVEKQAGVGRLLDVGCGNGDFLYEMKQRLWEVVGVETVPAQFNFASKTLGLKIFCNLADLLPQYRQKFDVITIWHRLGQFPNIHETLKFATELLHPEGLLMVALPNWISLDFWLYRQFWAGWDPPRRLYHFNHRQIRFLFKNHGLHFYRRKVIPFDIYYNCLLSEKNMTESQDCGYVHRKVRYIRALFAAMIAHILSISGAGSGMLYVAQRKGRRAQ